MQSDVQLLEGIDENDEEAIDDFDDGSHEDGIKKEEVKSSKLVLQYVLKQSFFSLLMNEV